MRLSGNDEISFGITDTYDRPGYAFTLPGDVEVPAGSYDMVSGELVWKLAAALIPEIWVGVLAAINRHSQAPSSSSHPSA